MFLFLFGGIGYFIGTILDNADRRIQLETFHFSSIPSTHEIFYSDLLPEAVIIYSIIDNTTAVLLDYTIEAKPEDFRLSVLKNLHEFEFRILEDSSKTIFSLFIEFQELDYPSLVKFPEKLETFFYDIKEQSLDFQGALQKIIPGLVLASISRPDILGNQNWLVSDLNNSSHETRPPDFGNDPVSIESDEDSKEEHSETEESILSDLTGTPPVTISREILSESEKSKIAISPSSTSTFLTEDKIVEQADTLMESHLDTESNSQDRISEANTVNSGKESSIVQNSRFENEESFEILETEVEENEKTLLARVVDKIQLEEEQRENSVKLEYEENLKTKESSRQEI